MEFINRDYYKKFLGNYKIKGLMKNKFKEGMVKKCQILRIQSRYQKY